MVQIIKHSSKLALGIYLFIYLHIYLSVNSTGCLFIIEVMGEESFKCIKQNKGEENLNLCYCSIDTLIMKSPFIVLDKRFYFYIYNASIAL